MLMATVYHRQTRASMKESIGQEILNGNAKAITKTNSFLKKVTSQVWELKFFKGIVSKESASNLKRVFASANVNYHTGKKTSSSQDEVTTRSITRVTRADLMNGKYDSVLQKENRKKKSRPITKVKSSPGTLSSHKSDSVKYSKVSRSLPNSPGNLANEYMPMSIDDIQQNNDKAADDNLTISHALHPLIIDEGLLGIPLVHKTASLDSFDDC